MRIAMLVGLLVMAWWTAPLWADDGGGDDEFTVPPPIEVSQR